MCSYACALVRVRAHVRARPCACALVGVRARWRARSFACVYVLARAYLSISDLNSSFSVKLRVGRSTIIIEAACMQQSYLLSMLHAGCLPETDHRDILPSGAQRQR
eukprot:5935010-Pleurochrysis_carterae.AAC.3